MSEMTAEKLAQRAYDVGLVDGSQLEAIWSDVGSRDAPLETMVSTLLRKEVLTNYQIDRILRGERAGFFYGKFRVLYLVGTGTFARVYRATVADSEKVFAVKVLRKRYRDNLTELEQFLREGRVGLELRHPNVVPIYEVEGDPRNPYMVMDFVEGQTLRDMVRIRGVLPNDVALHLLTDVVAGLAYAVEKGITHRDLKMSNVLVSSNGRAKLVDFGLAAAHTDNENELADCPNARAIDYAALERGTGVRKDDIRSDIFFAGCLMYNMVTGKPPLFETKDRLQRLSISRFYNIAPLNTLAPDLPFPIAALINQSMELDPTKRFTNPAEMLRECRLVAKRLEADGGDASEPDAASGETAEAGAAEAPNVPEARKLEGADRTVLVVESKIEMQDVLRKLLKKRGYRALIMSDPARAVQRFEDDPRAADVLVYSTLGLEERAVEAFRDFTTSPQTDHIPAILLVNEELGELAEQCTFDDHHVMLRMPLKVRQLREALVTLLNTPSPQ